METFRFTSADIQTVTFGHVNLRILNHWSNQDLWFSETGPASAGRPRKFSRINVIEAALAHDLAMAGVTRRDAKNYITLMTAKKGSGDWSGAQPQLLERRPAFSRGSEGWLWLLTFTESEGGRGLDELQELKTAELPENLAGNQHAAVIIPISAIVQRVDALDAEA